MHVLQLLKMLAAAVATSIEEEVNLPIDAFHGRLERLERYQIDAAIQGLCSLPAAKELSGAHVCTLLETAVSNGNWEYVLYMSQVTTGMQPSLEQLVHVLEAAVMSGKHMCILSLRQLPAAAHLSWEAMLQLLKTSVDSARAVASYTSRLCCLPAAAQLSSEQVLKLLIASTPLQCEGEHEVHALLELLNFRAEAAAQFSSEQVMQLLEAAVVSGSWQWIMACNQGASSCTAEPLSITGSEQVTQLLEAACRCCSVRSTQQRAGKCVKTLCKLPAAASLSVDQMMPMLKVLHAATTASYGGKSSGIGGLCNLPAAALLSAEHVLPLLLAPQAGLHIVVTGLLR
jgi:hypothetical protein